MKNNSTRMIKIIVFSGLFMALTTVMTAFFHVPSPDGTGYIHLGDSVIYLSSVLLPFPCGILVGGIGGALSDLVSGYAVYAIPTLIVKSINASCFYLLRARGGKILSKRSIIALILSSIVTVVGYLIVALILYKDTSFKTQLIATVPGNLIQAGGSTVLFLFIGSALDKIDIKEKVNLK